MLGEGSFGRVRLVVCKGDESAPCAVKGLFKGQLIRFQQLENVVAEKRLMQQCDHPFILRLLATFNREDDVHMMLELAQATCVTCVTCVTHVTRVKR